MIFCTTILHILIVAFDDAQIEQYLAPLLAASREINANNRTSAYTRHILSWAEAYGFTAECGWCWFYRQMRHMVPLAVDTHTMVVDCTAFLDHLNTHDETVLMKSFPQKRKAYEQKLNDMFPSPGYPHRIVELKLKITEHDGIYTDMPEFAVMCGLCAANGVVSRIVLQSTLVGRGCSLLLSNARRHMGNHKFDIDPLSKNSLKVRPPCRRIIIVGTSML